MSVGLRTGLDSRFTDGSRDLLVGLGGLFSGERMDANIPSLLLADTRGLGKGIFRSLLLALVSCGVGVGVFFYFLV